MVYFSVRARAECPRMIMEYGKIPYVDETCAQYFGKSWPDLKKEGGGAVPAFGQLPLLVVDGQPLSQSGSIVRYLAGMCAVSGPCHRLRPPRPRHAPRPPPTGAFDPRRRVPSLVPSDALTAARCDAVFEASQEPALAGINPIVNVFKGETFEQKKKEYFETFPSKLANLSRALGDGPFFFGATPLYCDFGVYHPLSNARLVEPTALDAHPNIVAFMAAFEALPGVAEYLAGRPQPMDIGTAPVFSPNVVGFRAHD